MATYDLPTWMRLTVASFQIQKSGIQFHSPFNGTIQAVNWISERWTMSLTAEPTVCTEAARTEAFLNRLAGGVNKVRAGHPTRHIPIGTMRGTPVIRVAASRGNSSIQLTTTTAVETLCAGDLIGVAGHLLQVAEDCTGSGSALTVPLVNRIRASIAVSTAVTWNRPTTLFVMPSQSHGAVYRAGYAEGQEFDLEEAWD